MKLWAIYIIYLKILLSICIQNAFSAQYFVKTIRTSSVIPLHLHLQLSPWPYSACTGECADATGLVLCRASCCVEKLAQIQKWFLRNFTTTWKRTEPINKLPLGLLELFVVRICELLSALLPLLPLLPCFCCWLWHESQKIIKTKNGRKERPSLLHVYLRNLPGEF